MSRRNVAKKLGLSSRIFDDDFPELMAQAQLVHQALLERLRYLEKTEPEFWCNLPWSAARAEWEATEGWKNEPCTDPRIVADLNWSATALVPVRLHIHWANKLAKPDYKEKHLKRELARLARLRAKREAAKAAQAAQARPVDDDTDD
jgi:hypothetical protein